MHFYIKKLLIVRGDIILIQGLWLISTSFIYNKRKDSISFSINVISLQDKKMEMKKNKKISINMF